MQISAISRFAASHNVPQFHRTGARLPSSRDGSNISTVSELPELILTDRSTDPSRPPPTVDEIPPRSRARHFRGKIWACVDCDVTVWSGPRGSFRDFHSDE